jgi:hypothetical protein
MHGPTQLFTVIALVALQILSRTTLSDTTLWVACFLLLFGVLARSGGFFVHLIPNRGKLGGRVTSAGAVLLAPAVLLTAYGVAFA